MINHVIEQVTQVLSSDQMIVATSVESPDDPLAWYVQKLGIAVFRGSLNNVVERFQGCLKEYPCTWFFRICADSPLLDSALLQTMLAYRERSDLDLVTNIYPRTFPKGRSAEMLYAPTFEALALEHLTAEQKEHATKIYYDRPAEFRIINITSPNPLEGETSYAIDTVEDLLRLEEALPAREVRS